MKTNKYLFETKWKQFLNEETTVPSSITSLDDIKNIKIVWTDCGGLDNELSASDRAKLQLVSGDNPITVKFAAEPEATRVPTEAEKAGGETEDFSIQRCVIAEPNAVGKNLELSPYKDIYYLFYNG